MSAINVNMMKCHHSKGMENDPVHKHACLEQPLLIPCPIPPSVTFQVALGKCDCPGNFGMGKTRKEDIEHTRSCPARPVSVSCAISGSTWEESEVTDAWPEKNDGFLCSTGETFPLVELACRDLWPLVKALVLGKHKGREEFAVANPGTPEHLFAQRDAVYAALCKMAMHEEGLQNAWDEFPMVLRVDAHFGPPEKRSSEYVLESYVAHLIEQVGTLGVAP